MAKDRHHPFNAPIVRQSQVAAGIRCNRGGSLPDAYRATLHSLGGRPIMALGCSFATTCQKEVHNADLCSQRMANKMP